MGAVIEARRHRAMAMRTALGLALLIAACAAPRPVARSTRPPEWEPCAARCRVIYAQEMPGAHLNAAGQCVCMPEIVHLRATLRAVSTVATPPVATPSK
jgi:hypothetical protein